MRRLGCIITALAVSVCLGRVVAAQELITNGGFETLAGGGAVGWTLTDPYGGPSTVPGYGPHGGTYAMYLGFYDQNDPNTVATLTQSGISTLPGHEYLVSFWLFEEDPVPGYLKKFKVAFDGTEYVLHDGTSWQIPPPTPYTWNQYSFTVYGTGNSSASLVFTERHNTGGWNVDDVSVFKTGEIIPEPTLIQLPALLGLAAIGYWRRRRSA